MDWLFDELIGKLAERNNITKLLLTKKC